MSEPLKLSDFGGIADSQVNPSPNSFFSLTNLRPLVQSDGARKALTSRPGIKHIEQLDAPIDAFAYNDFRDVKALLTLRDGNITATPAIYGGIGDADDVVLSDGQELFFSLRSHGLVHSKGTITLTSSLDLPLQGNGTIYSDQYSPSLVNGDFSNLHIGDLIISDDGFTIYGFIIAFFGPFLVRLSLSSPDIGVPNFPVKFKYQVASFGNVTAGDTITINGTVYTFVSGAPSGNQIQVGANAVETTTNIATRLDLLDANVSAVAFLNITTLTARVGGAAGDSITLAKSGANILLSAANLTGGVNSGAYLLTAVSTNTISIDGTLSPTNGILKYAIVRNASKNEFATVTKVNTEIPTAISLTLNKDVQALGWAVADNITFHRSDYNAGISDFEYEEFLDGKYDVISYPNFLNIDGQNSLAVFGILDKKYQRPFWIGNIKDRSYFNNNFKFNGLYATSLMDDFSYGPFSSAFAHFELKRTAAQTAVEAPIVVPKTETFGINLSLVLDGFNETKLLYSQDYGSEVTANESYGSSNLIQFTSNDNPDGTGYKVIKAKIIVPNYEILNRRVTHIRIYGRGISHTRTIGKDGRVYRFGFDSPYRLCQEIEINDSDWVVSSNTQTIEVRIDNAIQTGELYTDRLAHGYSEDLTKKVLHAVVANGRTFVVDKDNRTTVFFSPVNSNGFPMSVLPESNFIFFNRDQGEILGLYALPDRLIVWKQSSVIIYDITSLPNTGRDLYISSADGLIAPQSVVMIDRLIYFLSITGLRVTDGFKVQSESLDVQAHLSSYSTEELRKAIAFYDKRSFSYIVQVANDIWAFDIRVKQWRKEAIAYEAIDVVGTMGIVKYTNKNLLGETVVYCNNEAALYEYPRLDGLYMDSFNVDGSNRNVDIQCSFENNESFSSSLGLDSLMYVNNIYLVGEGIVALANGVMVSIRRNHATIKSAVIRRDNYIYPLTTRYPVDKFTLALSFATQSQVIIKEIGLYPKVFQRTGSQRVGAP